MELHKDAVVFCCCANLATVYTLMYHLIRPLTIDASTFVRPSAFTLCTHSHFAHIHIHTHITYHISHTIYHIPHTAYHIPHTPHVTSHTKHHTSFQCGFDGEIFPSGPGHRGDAWYLGDGPKDVQQRRGREEEGLEGRVQTATARHGQEGRVGEPGRRGAPAQVRVSLLSSTVFESLSSQMLSRKR